MALNDKQFASLLRRLANVLTNVWERSKSYLSTVNNLLKSGFGFSRKQASRAATIAKQLSDSKKLVPYSGKADQKLVSQLPIIPELATPNSSINKVVHKLDLWITDPHTGKERRPRINIISQRLLSEEELMQTIEEEFPTVLTTDLSKGFLDKYPNSKPVVIEIVGVYRV